MQRTVTYRRRDETVVITALVLDQPAVEAWGYSILVATRASVESSAAAFSLHNTDSDPGILSLFIDRSVVWNEDRAAFRAAVLAILDDVRRAVLVPEAAANVPQIASAEPSARARPTDPGTSHAAARQASVNLTAKQKSVLELFEVRGAMSDEQLVDEYGRAMRWNLSLQRQSDSGLRTRRSELVAGGRLVAVGKTLTRAGNPCMLWALPD